MSISDVFYENPDLFALSFPPPAQALVVQVIQSADPADMQARVQQAINEIAARNVQIITAYPEDQGLPLTLGDADLAGAGDGHTFVTTLYWVPDELNALNDLLSLGTLALVPQNIAFKFAMAGEGESLSDQIFAAITAFTGGEDGQAIWQFTRGGAKGTRFMFGVGGIAESQQQLNALAGGGGPSFARAAVAERPLTGIRAKIAAAKAKRDADLAAAKANSKK